MIHFIPGRSLRPAFPEGALMRTVHVLMVLVVGILMTGCDSEPTHESVAADMVGTLKQMTATLSGITTEATAKAAAPRIKLLREKMELIEKQMSALGSPSPEVRKRLEAKYEKEIETQMGEMMKQGMRIAMNPQLAQHVDLD
jgi:hypothetical protein